MVSAWLPCWVPTGEVQRLEGDGPPSVELRQEFQHGRMHGELADGREAAVAILHPRMAPEKAARDGSRIGEKGLRQGEVEDEIALLGIGAGHGRAVTVGDVPDLRLRVCCLGRSLARTSALRLTGLHHDGQWLFARLAAARAFEPALIGAALFGDFIEDDA